MTLERPDNVILFDQDCGFCKWSLDKILALDRDRHLRPTPIQGPEGDDLLADVPPERRLDSWHLVTRSGETFSGGSAAAPLADLLPWGHLPAAAFRRFPGATNRVYSLIARNRTRLARILLIDPSCEVRRT